LSLVSVVVPAWRDHDPLSACLEALGAQTIRDRVEIVVSLDGGPPLPEGTAAMADRVVGGPHAGPATARNRGWRASGGEYVLFTDSDCRPCPEWAERMAEALESGADAVKGAYSRGGGRLIQRLAQVEFEERYGMLRRTDSVDMVDTYSAGFRRSVLEEAGGFDESFPVADHEDVDLSYRLSESGKRLVFRPDALVEHTHRETWTGYWKLKFSRGRWRLRVLRDFPRKAFSDSYTPRCLKLQVLLAPAMVPALALLPVSAVPAAAWAVLFASSCIPLASVAVSRDAALVPVIPIFALWRGLALAAGSSTSLFPGSGATRKTRREVP
jgi:GT2 family glycosyltransferase